MFKLTIRQYKYMIIFGLLFSLASTIGYNITNFQTVFHNSILRYVGIAFVISYLGGVVFYYSPKIVEKINSIDIFESLKNIFFQDNKKSFFYCWLFIFICYIPILLAYFPGIFNYDVWNQVNFFVKHEHMEAHPMIHTLMIYGTVLFAKLIHNSTIAILTYSLMQISIMGGIFSYCVVFLSKYKFPIFYRVFALLFFALYPMNPMFSIIATKDSLFSALVLLFIIKLVELIALNKELLNSKSFGIQFILTAFFLFSFRHNGICAYLLLVPLLLFYFRENLKKIFILVSIPILLFFSYGAIKRSLGITPPMISETLSIPLQQMARVRLYEDNHLPNKDKQDFRNIVSENNEFEYNQYTVDDIKFSGFYNPRPYFIENSVKTNPGRFINLYCKWAIKYPKIYVDAFLSNTFTFYNPFGSYKLPEPFLVTHSTWKYIDGVKIPHRTYIMSITKLYDLILLNKCFEHNIILYPFFALGMNFWFIVFCLFALMYQKRYDYLISFSFLVFLFLTVLFGPTALLRYVYQNYLVVPLLLAISFSNRECDLNKY